MRSKPRRGLPERARVGADERVLPGEHRETQQSIRAATRAWRWKGTGRRRRAPCRAPWASAITADFTKPQIGVASTCSGDITPCNAHLDRLARKACEGILPAAACRKSSAPHGLRRHHDGPSGHALQPGVARGHRRLHRDVVAGGMNHDGLLAFGGCDKNMPGCVMAMARLNFRHLRLRRQHSARHRPTATTSSRSSRRSANTRRASSTRRASTTSNARRAPGPVVRRHVHRQHHDLRHRGDGLSLPWKLRAGGGERG